MPSNNKQSEIVVSGIGVTCAIGQGKANFIRGLLQGSHRFGVMQRPGRQAAFTAASDQSAAMPGTAFIGAEIQDLFMPIAIAGNTLRTSSFSSQVALATLHEAWHDAHLSQLDPHRIGLVVGGSNFQQRELAQIHAAYQNRLQFLRPTYGISFMDSDLSALCSETFGILGFAYTVGGASASGQLAVIQALQAVQSGQVDACIAIGALMDLSYWECQGLRALGAMGSDRFAAEPAQACRPFDRAHDGFIFGEACGVVVVEKADMEQRAGVAPYARLSGWALAMDGNRNPNPGFEGEARVLQQALRQAGLMGDQIDYINPHGTGSALGDATELKAIRHCGLDSAYLNATKSIIGHGLSAAGTVELIALLLQMQQGRLHPTRNLENPIDDSFNWVKREAITHEIRNAVNMSMGFGGINSAICVQKI